jgi:uncharacterized SAM-binding protein YcdF (DUF218 family)
MTSPVAKLRGRVAMLHRMIGRPAMPRGDGLPQRAWYRRRSFQLVLCVTLLSAVVAAGWCQRVFLLTAAGRWLDVGEPLPEPVDCVFILGGDADTRPFAAVALIRKGWARQALLAPSTTTAHERSHHELIREILLRRGVPAEAILELPVQVASTRDEARALRAFLEQRPVRSVAVITSDYHTRRTRAIFRRELAARATQVHFVSAPTERCKATNWWHNEQGWRMYIGEYAKMICGFGR